MLHFSNKISVYSVNLEQRPERYIHMEMQFQNKFEFKTQFIRPFKSSIGSISLWMTIQKIIREIYKNDDFFIFF